MNLLPEAIHVINLDRSPQRLQAVLDSFDRHLGGSGVALNRFVAIDAAEAEALAVPGRLSWSEKACFLSHARCLEAARVGARQSHVWIAEDDVAFGPQTRQRLASALEALQGRDWDILFTDLFATEPHGMIELFQLWRRATRDAEVRLLDLGKMAFASATSYIVNAGSVDKLLGLYRTCASLNMGVDIWFKELAGTGQAGCCCVVPFATTVADVQSQIQPGHSSGHLAWWYAFRWLLWEGTDPASLDPLLDHLERGFADPHAARAGRILGGMLSPRWEPFLRR